MPPTATPEMLFPTGTSHDVLYDDRAKKRETLIGHVNIFVKAEEEMNRKTPVSFMMRTIEKLVSSASSINDMFDASVIAMEVEGSLLDQSFIFRCTLTTAFGRISQNDSHMMIIAAAKEKATFFYLSFKTEKDFLDKNRALIEIAKMLRSRPDKVRTEIATQLLVS